MPTPKNTANSQHATLYRVTFDDAADRSYLAWSSSHLGAASLARFDGAARLSVQSMHFTADGNEPFPSNSSGDPIPTEESVHRFTAVRLRGRLAICEGYLDADATDTLLATIS